MKKLRKVLVFLLVLSLVAGVVPISSSGTIDVRADDDMSGQCGMGEDVINWELTPDDTTDWDLTVQPYKLTFRGSGQMYPYPVRYAPWYKQRGQISSIEVGEGITTISDYAFFELSSVKSVTLANSVESIGKNAFSQCVLLERVKFGSGLKIVGDSAFAHNMGLSEVQWNDGLETIGYHAFNGCSLSEVSLPDSVKEIGAGAFSLVDGNLLDFTLPRSAAKIGDRFISNRKLQNIRVADGNENFIVRDNVLYELKDGVPSRAVLGASASLEGEIRIAEGTESLATGAFEDAKNVSSFVLPDGLSTVGHYVFSGCTGVKGLLLPDSVQSIGPSAFKNCTCLSELVIPNSVQSVGADAFSGCTGLTQMELPDSVKTVENGVFHGCTSLRNIKIGKGLETFANMFQECPQLESIAISEDNPYLASVDNVIYSADMTQLYYYFPQKTEEAYYIPDTVQKINDYAIYEVPALKELYLPQSLSYFCSWAVFGNENLKSIYFYGNAPEAYGYPFLVDTGNPGVIIYRTAESTGWDAAIWTDYYNYEFAEWDPQNKEQESGVVGRLSWEYKGDTGKLTFTGTGVIPDFSEERTAPWSSYMSNIQMVSATDVRGIGNRAFEGAGKLLRLEAGERLAKIGDAAFADCGSLLFADIFSVETIGMEAFRNNRSLRHIMMEKVSSIGAGAFKGCEALADATLGAHMKTMETEVFADCSSLEGILVPDGIEAIDSNAFRGCTSLHSINIPAQVASIGAQAFAGDLRLENVYFYGGVPGDWAEDSFVGCSDGLTLYYRNPGESWEQLGGSWQNIPVSGVERFYTEGTDTYSFSNNAASFGYEIGYRIPRRQWVEAVGSIVNGTYYYAINPRWTGSCYGMAASALEFYENADFRVSNYDESAECLHDLEAPADKNAELTKLIEIYQLSQYRPSVAGTEGVVSRNQDGYRSLIHAVEAFERSGGLRTDAKADPIIMLVWSKYSGHAVIPVSVEQETDGSFTMQVYDPNYPSSLQELTVLKELNGISYDWYTNASFVHYSEISAKMQTKKAREESDHSLYISIDKENAAVINEAGESIEEIEGAYEQKPFNGDEEDAFTGIRSFVLPHGNYYFAAATALEPDAPPETESEENGVTFYLASEENYAKITSSDETAGLTVKEAGTQNGALEMVLQSDSPGEEKAVFSLMDAQGLERTVEVTGGNAQIVLESNENIVINVSESTSVSIDGKEVAVTDGQATGSFAPAPGEADYRVAELETDVRCDVKNRLSGSVEAEVVSVAETAKKVAVTAEYLDSTGKTVAFYNQNAQLQKGLNSIRLSFENLEATFAKKEGDEVLVCRLTVEDTGQKKAERTLEGITVTLTKQENTENPTVTGVTVSPETANVEQGKTQKFTATVSGENNPATEVTWGVSGNRSAATKIAADGTLTIGADEAAATVTVTATSKADATKSGTATVTVAKNGGGDTENPGGGDTENPGGGSTENPGGGDAQKPGGGSTENPGGSIGQNVAVAKVKGVPKTLTLGVGEEYQLKASVMPKNATDKKLSYRSSSKKVSVNAKGKIKAKKTGRASITVTAHNGKKAVLNVTVRKAPKTIKLNAKKKTLKAGSTFQIKVKLPKGTASYKKTFTSSKKSVATVSASGKVKAKKKGTATITVKTFNGKKAKIEITVKRR